MGWIIHVFCSKMDITGVKTSSMPGAWCRLHFFWQSKPSILIGEDLVDQLGALLNECYFVCIRLPERRSNFRPDNFGIFDLRFRLIGNRILQTITVTQKLEDCGSKCVCVERVDDTEQSIWYEPERYFWRCRIFFLGTRAACCCFERRNRTRYVIWARLFCWIQFLQSQRIASSAFTNRLLLRVNKAQR